MNRILSLVWGFACLVAWDVRSVVAEEHPNILVVVIDDLRWDDLGCTGHPFVRTPNLDRIAQEGVRFTNAFATTPLCSPSRACLLTGQYSHTHGIIDNTDRSPQSHLLPTFATLLKKAGYRTGFVGKWHMGNDDSPRPGFDQWVCLKGQGSAFDPELNIQGVVRRENGYVTDLLHRHAMDFVEQNHTQPFILYFAHKALHPETVQFADGRLSDPNASNFIPAPRHEELYSDQPIPRRPNALEPPADKPALMRSLPGLPPLGRSTGSSDDSIRGRLRMLAAVDESLGELLDSLESKGQLDRTMVVVTSDHGYFYGEHGLSVERRLAYEESIRIPWLMRYPRLIPEAKSRAEFVLTIDLAPTLLELCQCPIPSTIEGRSVLPLLQAESTSWRQEFLIEYYSDQVFPRTVNMGYQAIRTSRYKYIRYKELEGMDELYDLESDPYELNNRIHDSELTQIHQELSNKLNRLAGSTAR